MNSQKKSSISRNTQNENDEKPTKQKFNEIKRLAFQTFSILDENKKEISND